MRVLFLHWRAASSLTWEHHHAIGVFAEGSVPNARSWDRAAVEPTDDSRIFNATGTLLKTVILNSSMGDSPIGR